MKGQITIQLTKLEVEQRINEILELYLTTYKSAQKEKTIEREIINTLNSSIKKCVRKNIK